jgi:lactoylglutathione lyase
MRAIILLCILAFSICSSYAQKKQSIRINHTAIFVKNLKVTKDFYEKIIGLDTIAEPFHDGKHAWFSMGVPGIALHVIEGASEKKEYYKNQHTCFSVTSVEAFTAVLKKNNVVFEDLKGNKNVFSTRVDGIKQLWLQDPDGYWIEVNDAKE